MASATQRITLSAGWQKIAEAKGREAMALIDAYGAVQLAIADGEPPRGDVANGHALNGSMMWPVRGAEIVWARGNGVAVSVTLLKVVPEFATLDSAAVKVAAASAKVTATAADAKATQAQEVQARRDFAVWHLVDYLHPDDMTAALAGDTSGQNEARVTAAVQQFHDDMIAWWSAGSGRTADLIYPCVTLAMNDEMFSEDFADALWGMGFAQEENRINFNGNGVRFSCKNWLARARVRASGFYAAQGITYPVPTALFRWEQSSPRLFSPQIIGRIYLDGANDIATDPVAFKTQSCNVANIDKVFIRRFRNIGFMTENLFNSTVGQLEVSACGYQPTDAGGAGFIAPATRFSNVGAVVTATAATFDASHEGRWFFLAGAGPSNGVLRLVNAAQIVSVDGPTQITLDSAPDTDVVSATASFEAVRCATTAGSNIATLTAAITDDLTGRYVTIGRAGQQGIDAQYGSITAIITAHSGDQITLSHAARVTTTEAPVVFSSGLHIGRTAQGAVAGLGLNDDVTFDNLRVEEGGYSAAGGAVSAVITASTSLDFAPGSKFHGCATENNNFAGNFAGILWDRANNIHLVDTVVAHSGYSPRFGKQYFCGGRIRVEFTGDEVGFPDCTHTASLFNDLQPSPTVGRFYYGASRNVPRIASQVPARYGYAGLPSQIRAYNSYRTSQQTPDGADFPTYLDDLVLEGTLTGAGAVGNSADFSAGKVMLAGYGNETGTAIPTAVSDLDAVKLVHRTVSASASTVGAPDTLGAWVVKIVRATATVTVQRATRYYFNGAPVTVTRHDNNSGGAWSPWCLPDGATYTP
ncbi:hypothetical protein JWJ88_17320 [Paracoccus methylovorus]|uniref:Uncharacterized protein n=1 Tax=Paracoccus methylovorus TaxID=2812658 RepID=A0ABX7JKF4_9RHOB|nr:hypothetical protein [Paracoccus methylovorus]QRZ14725.1 hypothetical protein JWJ88_17320 [Paracoccus methylovorus]